MLVLKSIRSAPYALEEPMADHGANDAKMGDQPS